MVLFIKYLQIFFFQYNLELENSLLEKLFFVPKKNFEIFVLIPNLFVTHYH
jgi:hypothetical protein